MDDFDLTPFPAPPVTSVSPLIEKTVKMALACGDDWQTLLAGCLGIRFQGERKSFRDILTWIGNLSQGQRRRLLSLVITEIGLLWEAMDDEDDVSLPVSICTRRDDIEAVRCAIAHYLMENPSDSGFAGIIREIDENLVLLDEDGLKWQSGRVIEDDRLIDVGTGDPDAWWARPAVRYLWEYATKMRSTMMRRECMASLLQEVVDPNVAVLWFSEMMGDVQEPSEDPSWVKVAIEGFQEFAEGLHDELEGLIRALVPVKGDVRAIRDEDIQDEYWGKADSLACRRTALDRARANACAIDPEYRENPGLRQVIQSMDELAMENKVIFAHLAESPSVGPWWDLVPAILPDQIDK